MLNRLTTRLTTTAAAGLLALTLVGCGLQSGSTVVKYEKGQALPKMTDAPKSAMYSLYDSRDTTPQISYQLEEGDKLGFDGEMNDVKAVAGSNSYKIDPGTVTTYYWKMQKMK